MDLIKTPEFYNNLKNKILAQNYYSVMVCGDWNKNDTHGYVRLNNVKASKEVLGMCKTLI